MCILTSTFGEPDAIVKNCGYMNVNEGQVYVGVYRYTPRYPMPPTLLLNVV